MVLDGSSISHRRFTDFPSLLRAGDVLVLNETRVISARLFGIRRPGGGKAEILLLRPTSTPRYDPTATSWLALVKPARKLHPGSVVSFGDLGSVTVSAQRENGMREISLDLTVPLEDFLLRAGRMPLPPYVRAPSPREAAHYQTIFARIPGSVAAPTASLHFTAQLLAAIEQRGVQLAKIILNVGLGTFRPITSRTLDEHRMHSESYSMDQDTVETVKKAKQEGRRIVAAGTTVVRALEGCLARYGELRAGDSETDIFITPGYRFAVVDALLTNFHLPRSTLLVLICAFAGYEQTRAAYEQAIREKYRFFSFGDAMFIPKPTPPMPNRPNVTPAFPSLSC